VDDRRRPTVAVLGTGIMGGAMARRWAGQGWAVTAWNRSRDKLDALADAGVAAAPTPSDAVRGASFVVTMLADGDVTAEIMADAVAAMATDAVWLQMATVGVDAIGWLGRIADQAGIGFVDAPVSGTKQPAEQGALLVLAGGPEDLRARSEAALEPVAARVVWVGEAGAGSRLKLVVNSWLAALLAGLAESIALAEALGLDPRQFLDAIEGGPIGPAYASLKGGLMVEGRYPTAFPLRLLAKDVDLVAAAAHDAGIDLRLPAAERSLLDAVIDAHGDDDMSAVVEALRPSSR
jgi:3-hydroxyisobutyrate dehydrogenase